MNSSHLLLFFTLSLLFSLSLSSPNDTSTLTVFRLKTDTHALLLTNWTGTTACSAATWHGVRCSGDRVISLSLPSLSLRGSIDSLSSLTKLRLLDLHNNRLNGTVSPIINLTDLKLVYLASNDFSGEIPSEISNLRRMARLDLSDNNLRGSVPETFSRLVRLLTLRLQNNVLSGEIPKLSSEINGLKELNLSNNELYGRVSDEMLRKFGGSSFLGNEGLCGSSPLLPNCSFTGVSPVSNSSETVPSNPSSFPSKPPIINRDDKKHTKKISTGAIVAIVIANSVVLLVIMSFVVAFYCSNSRDISNSKTGNENKKVYESNHRGLIANGGDSDRSKLVFYDSKKQFELEDLLRASAEMLGKGSLGTVYKAALDDGCIMAVKRLKDANPCARKEFEQYMDVIGRLKHPNIVRFRAYYYAKEEKLLVYDYLPNGTLHYLLHGNRGPGRIPLDWTTRISLVLGAARGLAKIHEEYASSKLPHGNVRSSNILLDKNGVACISDFGLSLLLNPVHATARLGGYRAPEQTQVKRLSQKADVYSFGILLLEILTGKEEMEKDVDLPRWVRSVVRAEWTAEVFDQELLRYKNIEEELVSMLQVGMSCVMTLPEKRPTMDEVVKMIEDIRLEESPIGDDYDESRDSVSPSHATTEDGLGNY